MPLKLINNNNVDDNDNDNDEKAIIQIKHLKIKAVTFQLYNMKISTFYVPS